MTIKEAVLALKRYQGYEPMEYGNILKHSFDLTDETVDTLLSAIRTEPAGEPLTLEQLREMDGEPVWVTPARERGNIPSRWLLFAGVSKSKRNSDVFVFATTGGIAQGYEAVNYGKTWNAYRRPPEGDEDA